MEIRRALGARSEQLFSQVALEVLRLAMIGAALGILAAYGFGFVLKLRAAVNSDGVASDPTGILRCQE